jgi:hypothetical protein
MFQSKEGDIDYKYLDGSDVKYGSVEGRVETQLTIKLLDSAMFNLGSAISVIVVLSMIVF